MLESPAVIAPKNVATKLQLQSHIQFNEFNVKH